MPTRNQKRTEYVLQGSVIVSNQHLDTIYANQGPSAAVLRDAGIADMVRYDNALVTDVHILRIDYPTIHFILRFKTDRFTPKRWESFGLYPSEGIEPIAFNAAERMHIAMELLMHEFEFLSNDEEELEVFPQKNGGDDAFLSHLTTSMYGTVNMADVKYVDVRVDDSLHFPRFFADIDPVYGTEIRELTAEQALQLGNELRSVSARIKGWESIVTLCQTGGQPFQRLIEHESQNAWFREVKDQLQRGKTQR